MKKQSISFRPDRETVCTHYNEGGNIRVIVGDRPAFLDSAGNVAKAFNLPVSQIKLADVCRDLYGHGGHITLSLP